MYKSENGVRQKYRLDFKNQPKRWQLGETLKWNRISKKPEIKSIF